MYLINYIKRGRGDTIYFPLIDAGTTDFATSSDYTYAAGDFKISIDGAANANPTNTPTYDADARMWSLALTDAETTGRVIIITVVDSATKAVDDQSIIVTTDVANGIVSSDIATLASQTSFTIASGSADNDAYNGYAALITDATSRDQRCLGIVSDYVGSTKTVTLQADPGIFTMAAGDYIELIPAFATSGLSAQAKLDVNTEADTALADYDAPTKAELDSGFAALNDLTAAQVNAEVDTAISDAALATAAALATVDGIVDAILVDTGTTLDGKIDTIDTLIDAIKVKTDDMVFTKANELDVNAQSINGASVTGDGNATPWDGA